MKKYDYVIVGAGLFGCTFAYEMRMLKEYLNKYCIIK